MTKSTSTRPPRVSMEGMIWSANHVLEAALDPKNHGVPAELFDKCVGVVLLSVVQAGLVFTGHYGTGVLMAKRKADDGSDEWSAPVAAGAMGYGGGAFIGAEVDYVLSFILDEEELVEDERSDDESGEAESSADGVSKGGGTILSEEEVERLVTFPLESAINGAPGIRRLRSVSADGISVWWVEFAWETKRHAA